jgi:hypothetical protein
MFIMVDDLRKPIGQGEPRPAIPSGHTMVDGRRLSNYAIRTLGIELSANKSGQEVTHDQATIAQSGIIEQGSFRPKDAPIATSDWPFDGATLGDPSLE